MAEHSGISRFKRHGSDPAGSSSVKGGHSSPETRAQLQQRVLCEIRMTSACHPDGMIYPCPAGIEDDVLDLLFKNGLLAGVSVDDLVTRSFDLLMNEDDEAATKQLTRLRQRLLVALSSVDDRLRLNTRRPGSELHS